MGQRYWVIGGEYRDCRFDEVVPGHRGNLAAPSRMPIGRGPNGSA